jgi:iron complex outermembrane recepter protein
MGMGTTNKTWFAPRVSMLMLAWATSACLSGTAYAQSEGSVQGGIGEIVVTAQRREERLQDVPIAVTAISEQSLQNRQMTQLVDIMTTIPNLHASNNIGQGSATTVFIRGVGETESIVTIDPPVGFYIDDVVIARQGVNNMALFDVERIEVLRGPQGTLYGRNTSAGAMKIITKKPEFRNGGSVEGSYGRFNTWMLRGAANLALGEETALRFNAMTGDGDGDTFNRILDKRVNGAKTSGFRAAFRHKPGDLEINLSADWARGNQNGRYGYDVSGILRPPAGNEYISSTDTVMRNIGKAWGLNGTVDYHINDTLSFKSITAFRNTTQNYNLELTDQAPSLYIVYSDVDTKQFTQEFQLSGSGADDRLNYVAGLYYFNEKSDQIIGDYIFSSVFFRKDIQVKSEAYAAYAQASFNLTDAISVIAGGRFTRDEKSIDMTQIADFTGVDRKLAPFAGVPIFDNSVICGQTIPARPSRPVSCNLGVSRFTPKLGLEFKPNNDLMLYAMWTRGFKSGGWSARVTAANEFFDFDPESIDSYEIGLKSTVGSGIGTVNLTGFYYDYKNLFNTGTTAAGSFGIAISDAKIWGLELETNWKLANGVRAFANLAWQDNELSPPAATTIVLGNRLQRTPKIQGSVGINVNKPIADNMTLIGNADYSYIGKHFVSPQNFPVTETGPVNLFNASLGVGFNDEAYQLVAGCKNCFGETYFNQALPFAAFGFVTIYPSPRAQWTLTARAKF